MDPLSITASIVGILTATAQVGKALGPYISTVKDPLKIVTQVHSEVQYTRSIMLALEGLTNNMASVPVRRAALIQIDQLIAVFTDGVLLFSELEASLPSRPPNDPSSSRLPLQSRLQWAWKESTLAKLLTRLQGFKGSISLMLTILQSDSDIQASQHQQELSENVAAILESNQSLSRRLMNLEDAFEVRSIVSKQQSLALTTTNGINDDTPTPQQLNQPTKEDIINKSNEISQLSIPPEGNAVSSFDFENDLEASRVYRRAQRDTVDFSFRSSITHTNAWSVFSGLSLSDVSIISAIALPLYADEITNAQHYGFGESQTIAANLPTTYAPRVRTLYEKCLEVELQLSQLHGFSEIFATLRDDSEEEDPLTFLIRVFRRGLPLLILLSKMPGHENLIDINKQRVPKAATFLFVEACMSRLGFQPDECFSISDLFKNDTTGLVKVIEVVSRLLDTLTSIGELEPVDSTTLLQHGSRGLIDPTPRDMLLKVFLVDERAYVADLERLLELKRKIEMDGGPINDSLRRTLSSLNAIIDIQRRFLLKVEMEACKPSDEQSWARHFQKWASMSSIYADFITSEKGAREFIRTVLAEQQRVDNGDLSFVLKDSLRLLYLPSQRLPKYSDFLGELDRQGDLSASQASDVATGIQALQNALRDINAAMKTHELHEVEADLLARVKDWKNHQFGLFGSLLLFDVLDVANTYDKSDKPRVYHVYLYERIILLCKGYSPTRTPGRGLIFRRAKNTKSDLDATLILKGRIFNGDIVEVVSLSKPGSYTCQVWWKGNPGIENMILKFPTESKMNKWNQEIERARKRIPSSAGTGSPTPDFAWMKGLANPHKDDT